MWEPTRGGPPAQIPFWGDRGGGQWLPGRSQESTSRLGRHPWQLTASVPGTLSPPTRPWTADPPPCLTQRGRGPRGLTGLSLSSVVALGWDKAAQWVLTLEAAPWLLGDTLDPAWTPLRGQPPLGTMSPPLRPGLILVLDVGKTLKVGSFPGPWPTEWEGHDRGSLLWPYWSEALGTAHGTQRPFDKVVPTAF